MSVECTDEAHPCHQQLNPTSSPAETRHDNLNNSGNSTESKANLSDSLLEKPKKGEKDRNREGTVGTVAKAQMP